MPRQPSVGERVFRATCAVFAAKRDKALANLHNYFSNPTAIGEHPDLVEECEKLVIDVHDAEGCLEVLSEIRAQSNFSDTQESPSEKPPF